MLTCEQACDGLDLLVAGEAGPEEIREHVAACDACRHEREARTRERARLREELAALSPSPFLEDEVLEIARSTRIPTTIPTTTPTTRGVLAGARRPLAALVTAAAALAAVAVFAFGPWLRSRTEGVGPAAGEGATIAVPPSAREVRAAREANPVASEVGRGVAPVLLNRGPGGRSEDSPEFLRPWEGVAHRWVYGDAEGRPGPRTYTIGLPAEEGVMLLGSDVMRHFGEFTIAFTGTDDALVVEAGGKRWEALPGTSRAEVTIGSPEDGGSEARIRVAVSTAYTGGLLLTGPLARALGLNQFEIPGGFEIEGWGVRGQRARARLRIPELGFDRVVQVQVMEDSPGAATGEARSFGVPSEAFPGFPETTLHVGPDGPGPTDRLTVVRLRDRFAPQSLATIARVWRGRTAIPSREAVAQARVGADGTLSFARMPGELGTTLRMHLRKPDGSEEFRDVVVDAPAGPVGPIAVTDEDGVVVVRFTEDPNGIPADRVDSLLESFRASLRRFADAQGRDEDGTSRVRMRLAMPPTAPWKWVQWALMVGATPAIRILHVELASEAGGEALGYELPRDRGLASEPSKSPQPVWIKLIRRSVNEGAFTQLTVGRTTRAEDPLLADPDHPSPAPYSRDRAGALADFETRLSAALAEAGVSTVVLSAPPPYGGQVPFRDVYDVLRVVRQVGITDVRFEGSPLLR